MLDIDPVMRAPVRRTGVSWSTPGFPQDGDGPVVWVTWNDAAAFAGWLARATGKPYRLPTEAEWEFAAREGGRDSAWSGTAERERAGDSLVRREQRRPAASGRRQDAQRPRPVRPHGERLGMVPRLAGALRILGAAARVPGGPAEGRFRVLRGGSWRVGLDVARTTYRNGYRPDYAHSSIGFRVALPADVRI